MKLKERVKICLLYVLLVFLGVLDTWVYLDTKHVLALFAVALLTTSFVLLTVYVFYLSPKEPPDDHEN